MVNVDVKAITKPVGIIRIIVTVLTCMCFCLAAAVGHNTSPYWAWCMFTWSFCFIITLLILTLEFAMVSMKVPFAWDDFTAAFAILASLLCLSASIIYPIFFTCSTCHRQIGASVVSWVCFAGYVTEVVFSRLQPSGETRGFLSTIPGILKMLEIFLACLIFMSLESGQYSGSSPLQWCIAVYSLCFIFAILIIIITLAQLTSYFPFPFEIVTVVYNVLAAVMYLTAMVIWPLYSFRGNKRPSSCTSLCPWDKLVVVTLMTIFNFIIYTMDAIYCIVVLYFIRNE